MPTYGSDIRKRIELWNSLRWMARELVVLRKLQRLHGYETPFSKRGEVYIHRLNTDLDKNCEKIMTEVGKELDPDYPH